MREFKVVVFLIIYLIIHGIFAEGNNTSNTPNIGNYSSTASTIQKPDDTEITKPNCTETMCIAKCCPENQLITISVNKDKKTNQIVRKRVCTDHKVLSFADFPVFDKDFYKTDKKVREQFNVVGPNIMNITNFASTRVANTDLYYIYLLNDSSLVLEVPNRISKERWTYYNTSTYCIDYIRQPKDGKLIPRYFLIPKMIRKTVSHENYHLSAAMLVSCVFLALVLVVYWLLPDLRNLRGLVLMSYVLSLLAAFTLFATLNLLTNFKKSPTNVCKSFSFSIYFCILSSFFWMNVMSLDIWWTFRGFAKVRMIHRRGEWFKYLVYCSYAWGVPLLMTGALIVLNETDMRHLPWFVTPQIAHTGCFISATSRLLYLYLPMMVMLVMNSVFFMMTVFNMWRLSRGHDILQRAAVAAGTPSAHISNRNRFMVYLKLSAVMGVNWVLEVISSLEPEWPIWYITDIYNLITGFIIFFIFVCKKKIWRMLVKRYSHQGSRSRWFPRSSAAQDLPTSASDSEVSQETPLQCVSYDTRGQNAFFKR